MKKQLLPVTGEGSCRAMVDARLVKGDLIVSGACGNSFLYRRDRPLGQTTDGGPAKRVGAGTAVRPCIAIGTPNTLSASAASYKRSG